MLATIVAIVVGIANLIPHIRAEQLTPVVLQPAAEENPAGLIVHISGAVAHQGVYTVDESTSLGDLLRLTSPDRDAPPHTITVIIDDAHHGRAPQRIDLNYADAWLLQALPGIGPERARAIVDYRERHGLFTSTEELTLVPGIGTATYEGLKEFVTVTP